MAALGNGIRALSLDLGETTFWDTAEIARAQGTLRIEILGGGLGDRHGRPLGGAAVGRGRSAVLARWSARGLLASSLPNAKLIEEVRRELGAKLLLPLDELAQRYSDAGLHEHPPHLNPQARELILQALRAGLKVMAISDTSRSGPTWLSYLREVVAPGVASVTTSCDVSVRKPDPRLFLAAARSIEVAPTEILHVGDRWDRDVAGGEASGMRTALYTGLWSKYWNLEEGPPRPPPKGTSTPVLKDLTEVAALLGISKTSDP
ncbi:MAG: HAD family hydrolase [Euryarchaeota archaeon]|nr:HAD family hydrolase [Euryarchaeota archaeon]MDE1836976.1 HAD family hydrolase [Euryarchaeota archaeon]MDE1880796.1 HAD family hydrolase [Euryarchaeota archaeon]MDE2045839.1 HAD family hydrolase [Thermoplasmata archaeon]